MAQKMLSGKKITRWAIGIPNGKDNARYLVCDSKADLIKEIRFFLKEGEQELIVKSFDFTEDELLNLPDFDGM